MDRQIYCLECGQIVGLDGWCPYCGDSLCDDPDAWDDEGCSGPIGRDDEAQPSDYDLETPLGQRYMDGEEEG